MSQDKKIEEIKEILDSDLESRSIIKKIKSALLIGDDRTMREIVSSFLMVLIGIALIVFIVLIRFEYGNEVKLQEWLLKSIVALAAGCMAVGFSGNINIRFHWVQASGSLAIVVLFYATSPVSNSSEVTSNTDGGYLINGLTANVAYAQESPAQTPPDQTARQIQLPKTDYLDRNKTTIRINFPTGLDSLKKQSLEYKDALKEFEFLKEARVFELGSIFSVPLNKLIGSEGFYFKIVYHKSVNDYRIREISEMLKRSNPERKFVYEIGKPQSDIDIYLIPSDVQE
ncbi:hypothetical protein KJ966_12870 [bacterium]|nr:hypothetical protein [bacterium]